MNYMLKKLKRCNFFIDQFFLKIGKKNLKKLINNKEITALLFCSIIRESLYLNSME